MTPEPDRAGADGPPASRSPVRRALRAVGELVAEALFEGVLAVVACLSLLGAGLAVGWGLRTFPRTTAGILGALLAFGTYGGWQLWRARRGGLRARGRLAFAAGVFVVAVGVWLLYVLSYCTCRG